MMNCRTIKVSLTTAVFAVLLLIMPLWGFAQSQTSPTDGIRENTPAVFALTNATIVTTPGSVISSGTLVIRDGVIEAVGANVRVPADARVFDLDGKTVYPGFIDAHARTGMQDAPVELDRGNQPWNPQLRAHLRAEQIFNTEDDGSEALRKMGFTVAASVPELGIFRGQTAALTLRDGSPTDRTIRGGIAQSVSLSRSSEFGFTYPTSNIGAIALIRQTLYDARWYHDAHTAFEQNPAGLQRPEYNAMLHSLTAAARGQMPLLIEAGSDEEVLRALRIADEFDSQLWVRGSGHEYRIADYLRTQRFSLILPLSFPDTPEVGTPEDAYNRNLAELRHWYLAPENPARLAAAGIAFSLTTDGLENPSHFLPNLRKAVEAGLPANTALAALTTQPAELLGISATHGSLTRGKAAHFVVTDGDLFHHNTRIMYVWIDGHRHIINREPHNNPAGSWELASDESLFDGRLSLKETRPGRFSGELVIGDDEISLNNIAYDDHTRRFRADFQHDDISTSGPVRLTASLRDDRLHGWAEVTGQSRINWNATRMESGERPEPRENSPMRRDLELTNLRPSMEFGREQKPEQARAILVQNATIWTQGPEGILENADLLVRDGKIAEVGHDLRAPRRAVVIDAEGRHVTPGLIDAHLHSGVDGVNEIGNAITAEVRMADVLNINNIWMYRQLAGGLTTAHVMHGSANPIGGQNVTLKMRWGALSHELPLEGAPRTVKFALGENPKRVGTGRYPDTRMGVEQIIADRFQMAKDYRARWQEWERNGSGIPPRRDLRLDALADILDGNIDIHSHSYRQDEILMLMVLAEEIGFEIKAFHHALEAFKVAPELAERGIGAVVWTDWGGFKIEAYDNTNYNARLLLEAGVPTSLHSDNSQIATRMNWEAAKMVRTGLDPETALSLVTNRTAALLGIEDRVGSLEPGKDADFVIWSGDPLSTFTIAEQTWIDGRRYFDIEEDAALRAAVDRERAELIRLILEMNND
ncbi:Imidazolonepropionase [Cyclonatronum proteinivorum]|uniref:Imidazolonepropionase n=1 Tax=Cyclonatronum proteinivorum TaxID=1457365 RepID=A0A345UL51_9BACT|nr:amidohydrolase family protein [Cyclonatronum proteinivorum]AXJ01203.1 Imidazolonepropionase [Cyclonatronum proteinivorum]